MKVAISQPMRGKTEEQIAAERQALVEELEAHGFNVVNTIIPKPKKDFNPMKSLSQSLELMADADAIVFMPGWELSRGCTIEHRIAEEYNKIIILLPEEEEE